MKDDVIIIPVKKKDLGVISKKSIAIGALVGMAVATLIGATVIYKNLHRS